MPRGKPDKWKLIHIKRNGVLLTAYLHPIGTVGNSRYWSLTCREAGIRMKSLKATTYSEALEVAHNWFEKEPQRTERERQEQAVLTWEGWDAIQVFHARKRSERNKRRAERTLEECRKAQRLFVKITGAESASAVDADMVEQFQAKCAQTESKLGKAYSPSGIRKTLAHLSASFNRCRITAGKKCIRGVVPKERLLTINPFEEVQWVEADEPEPRQFTREEMKAFLTWKFLAGCPLVCLFAKASFWARGRIEEMTNLRWDWIDAEGYLTIPADEAKWGKGKVIRIPPALLDDIRRFRTNSPFVWAGYVEQLRKYHLTTGHHGSAHKIKDFGPERFRIVFQKWIAEWAKEAGVEGISHHAFRRTGLQMSREGKLRSFEAEFAQESNVSRQVAEKHYTTDPQRLRADITYRNIVNEIREDREFATFMGLTGEASISTATVADVQDALARNDIKEATRLLALLGG